MMLTAEQIAAALARPTIDVTTAGKVMGVCRGNAYKMAAAGQIPTIRNGRKWLVPTAKLREALGMPAAA